MSSKSTRSNARCKVQSPSPHSSLSSPLQKALKNSSNSSANEIMVNSEEQCTKQSELIVSLLSSKLLESEQRILNKIDQEVATIKSNIAQLEERVSRLESRNTVVDALTSQVFELQRMVDVQENRVIAADALLYKVPFSPDENLKSMFNHLCHSIAIKAPSLKNIYRIHSKSSATDSPIMIKFNSAYEKNFLLKSIALHCKHKQSQLCLHDVGINSDVSIYFHEALTKHNHMLMKHALVLKKKKKIAAVFTYRGLVYVRRESKSEALSINSLDGLAGIVDCNNNSGESSSTIVHHASDDINT